MITHNILKFLIKILNINYQIRTKQLLKLLCELTLALANTIYKFYIKLIKYDIICKTFIETTKKN
jgi:hypothetical protein